MSEQKAERAISAASIAIDGVLIALACAIAVLCGNYFLFAIPNGYDVDTTYRMILNEAFAGPLRFGGDFGTTYGPLGFIAAMDLHPVATPARALIVSLFTTVLFATTYIRFIAASSAGVVGRVVAALALGLFLPLSGASFTVTLFFAPLPLLLADEASTSPLSRVTRPIFAALLAIGALMKVSTLTGALIGFVLIIAYRAVQDRRVPLSPFVFAFVYVAGFLITGQTLSDFLAFHAIAFEVVSGYSKENALFGGRTELGQIALLALYGVLILIAFARPVWRRGYIFAAFAALAAGLVFFMAFKAGFTRYSHSHVTQTYLYLCTAALALSGMLLAAPKRPLLLAAVPLFVALIFLQLSQTIMGNGGYLAERVAGLPSAFSRSFGDIAALQDSAALETRYREALDVINARGPLADFDAAAVQSADVYPDEQALILASAAPYRPRPSTQSLTATTPHLLQLNQEHLLASGPDAIFVRTDTPNGALPAFSDSTSWLAFLSHYEAQEVFGPYTRLARRAEPAAVTRDLLWEGEGRFGEPVPIPESETAWVEIDVRPTILGRIAELLYKIPPTHIDIERLVGGVSRFTYSRASGRAGFLISPVIQDDDQFRQWLMAPNASALMTERARAFTLVSRQAGWLHQNRFHVRLYSIQGGGGGSIAVAAGPPQTDQERITRLWRQAGGDARIIPITLPDGTRSVALRASAPFAGGIAVPADSATMSMIVDLESDTWTHQRETNADGVELRFDYATANAQPLGAETFVIGPETQQRPGARTLTLALPAGTQTVTVNAHPRSNGAYDNASYYGIAFEP